MENEHAAAVFLVLVSVTVAAASHYQPETVTGEFYTGGEKVAKLNLEVADEPQERKKGLMNRKSLPRNSGMLFIFPEEKDRVFWMKDTYIPLDIVFLDTNLTVVDIQQADPQQGVPASQLERYRSSSPAKYVVEVNQGFASRNDIEEGSRLVMER